MKQSHILTVLALVTGLISCAPEIQLNRVRGVRGPNAPVITSEGVLFSIDAPDATLVTIAGSFNGWNTYATELTKNDAGVWSIMLPLQPGRRYQYKFLIDGFWIADPDNPDTAPDGHGGVNSIIHIKEGA